MTDIPPPASNPPERPNPAVEASPSMTSTTENFTRTPKPSAKSWAPAWAAWASR